MNSDFGSYSKRQLFETKLGRLQSLISQSERTSPSPRKVPSKLLLRPISDVSSTPISQLLSSKQRSSITNVSNEFVSEMMQALKNLIIDRHSPAKSKVTLANAQKFIHLRRQDVPFNDAVKLSARKIGDSERQDIEMLLKQVTLLKFSEEHYDYEHITKQYEFFENTHQIVDGLIITENNAGYATETDKFHKLDLEKLTNYPMLAKRRALDDLNKIKMKHGLAWQQRKGMAKGPHAMGESQMKAFSKYVQRWNEPPKDFRNATSFKEESRRNSKLQGIESFLGSFVPSGRSSYASLKPLGKT